MAMKQDTSVTLTVRTQMEALEKRLGQQFVQMQEQVTKFMQASSSRQDDKLALLESSQPKLERKLAELAGKVCSLSEEMQLQVRRIDRSQDSSRMADAQREFQEEAQIKFTELEGKYQQVSSAVRVARTAGEEVQRDSMRRLLRLEGMMGDHAGEAKDTNLSLIEVHQRLTDLEMAESERARMLALSPDTKIWRDDRDGSPEGPEASSSASTFRQKTLEAELAEAMQKIVVLETECRDIRSRHEAQEERLRTMRKFQDTQEKEHKNISYNLKMRSSDSRILDLIGRVKEHSTNHMAHAEHLEILQNKVARSMQAHEELGNTMRRQQEKNAGAIALAMAAPAVDGALPLLAEALLPASQATDALVDVVSQLKELGPRLDRIDRNIEEIAGRLPERQDKTNVVEVQEFEEEEEEHQQEEEKELSEAEETVQEC